MLKNKIINRIKNTIKLEKILNQIGFINIQFINKRYLIKYAIYEPDKTNDKSYAVIAINKIKNKLKDNFNALNLMLMIDNKSQKNNKLYYQYMGTSIACTAEKQYTKEEYYLSSHVYQLHIPEQLKNAKNPIIQFYIENPIIWIINCYKNINNVYKYEQTKTIFLPNINLIKLDFMTQNFNLIQQIN